MKHRFKTLVKLTIWTSIVLHLTNKFIEYTSVFRHLLKVNENNFYDFRHGRIYYKKCGSGSPILLIHDLHPSSSLQEWTSVIDSLSENHTVYAIDLLGCGRSEKPHITYCNYLYVQLLTEFTQDIIKEKTDIICTGKSGSFAVMAAKLNSDLFGTITMVNPESFGRLSVIPNLQTKIAGTILKCPILGVSMYYFLTSQNQLDYEFAEKYFYNPFHLTDKTIYTYYESAHLSRSGGRYLLSSLKSNYLNFDIRYGFSKLTNPIHLVFGGEQPSAQKIADIYMKANSNVSCSFVEKTKMLPQLEAPELFLKNLKLS